MLPQGTRNISAAAVTAVHISFTDTWVLRTASFYIRGMGVKIFFFEGSSDCSTRSSNINTG